MRKCVGERGVRGMEEEGGVKTLAKVQYRRRISFRIKKKELQKILHFPQM